MLSKELFEDSLLNCDFPFNWLKKSKTDVELELGNAVSNMVGFDQKNSHHCYTLFEHCVRAAAAIKVESREDVLLKTAAFFHDMAKPIVAREKESRLVFYGHAIKSADMVKPLLQEMGYQGEELNLILFLIGHHDDFINYTDKPSPGKADINEKNLLRFWRRLKENYPTITSGSWKIYINELFKLCEADALCQSELVLLQGKLLDSRSSKLERLQKVKEVLIPIVENS